MITHLLTNEKFTHIVHCTDVHVRLTKRHQEYREVFNRLFESVKNTPKNTAIFILGDVVNSKNDLSPECVQVTKEFLVGLSNLRSTVLVAGNHDCNLSNKSRLDSLSPIVEAINHPNLFYLKQSGIYAFGNICINNYSVFDSPDKYLSGIDIPQTYRNKYEYFVCLYHGQVDGAMTDLGFRLVNPAINLGTFDNHDIALLGDIHKEQDLQLYDFQQNRPAIRYAGSLIQQRHDEPLEGHGYSFWDLKNKSYVHKEIQNDYGFYTVLLENGVISTDLTSIPKKARVRLQLKNTTLSERKEAVAEIKKITEIVETSYQKLDKNTTLTRIPTAAGNVVLGDISDKNYQETLLREYLKTKLNVTDPVFIDGILKINNEVNDSVKKDDFARNIRWIPIKFEWDNMFSYGEKNVIDFTKTKDVMGLFAANASGKSSVFSAMTFCLFDKCERDYKAGNIMNSQKTEFSCKFEFEIDSKRYIIERKGKADKRGKVKVDVRFWKLENGQEVDLNGEQRKDTNEIIREYLGSYDDFVLTSLSVQNGKNNASIIDMGDTDRKDLFAQFMGLTVFDRLYTEGNDRLRERLVALRTYKNDDYAQKLIDFVNLKDQVEELYKDEQEELAIITKSKEDIQKSILEETKKLVKIEGNIPNIEVSKKALLKAQMRFSGAQDAINRAKSKVEDVSGQLKTLDLTIKELEDKKVLEIYELFQQLITHQKELDLEIAVSKENIKNYEKICKNAESLKYDPNCPFCVTNAGKVAADAKDAKFKAEEFKKDLDHLNKVTAKNRKRMDEIEWSISANTKYQKVIKERNSLKDALLLANGLLKQSEQELVEYKVEMELHRNNISLYEARETDLKYNATVNETIESYRRGLEKIEYSHKAKTKSIMDLNGKISICKNQISEINKKIDQIKIAEQEYKLYEAYCQAVSRDGIPFDVITATVPEIQTEVNNILGQIADFTALFETDGKNIIPYIVYENDKKWLMSLTSGFEKFALSLAIRVALINISNLPRPNFLIIDEGFGVLDAENLSQMSTLFTYLKTSFDFVLIVSHLDALRDMVDKHIEITKDNGFSKVEFI